MSVCPGCGIEVSNPTKTWSMVGRPSKKGERFKLTLGLFECPQCETRFRKVVGKKREKITLKAMIEEIKGIERGLVRTLGDVREKIEKLKSERSDLLFEIEKLKEVGEEKASALENEISSLREEIESLKEVIGDD